MLQALDRVVLLKAGDPRRQGGIDPLLGLFCREGQGQKPGNRAVTADLLKLLFIEILRSQMAARNRERRPCESNPLVLAFEPTLKPAAEAIYFEPEKPWTIAELADLSGLSRTTFAVRFQAAAGTSPLAYLTQVRIHKAMDLLKRSDATLAAIAVQVGYGSEAAFSTAFKRQLGVAPGAYRNSGVSSPLL